MQFQLCIIFFFLSCGIAVVNNRLDALFVCIKYLPEEGLE